MGARTRRDAQVRGAFNSMRAGPKSEEGRHQVRPGPHRDILSGHVPMQGFHRRFKKCVGINSSLKVNLSAANRAGELNRLGSRSLNPMSPSLAIERTSGPGKRW
jgi:hypothetical protein